MSENKIVYLSKALPVSMADEWFSIANKDHFWMQWRFFEIKKMIGLVSSFSDKTFEIGCGNAVVMQQMEQDSYSIDGCDLNLYALEKSEKTKGKLFVYNIFDQHQDVYKKYKNILLLDVIEHIEDDVTFIKQSIAHTEGNGYIIINVPASMMLFSKYDSVAGHVRRYNKAGLRKSMEEAGLQDIQIRYWGWSLIPIAILRKIWLQFKSKEQVIESGFKPGNMFTDKILRSLMSIEQKIGNFSFGTSLIAIAKIPS
ncbi:MAG TPA: methyltransferase domain-containing protein [Saprospiraceae bacterium]|nr:methyltransferase domain-containing protein [Saprospiraceae bacterium]